jgi:hypothetical protein
MQQIKIDTVDNPGWFIRIDLLETSLENEIFNRIQIERTETDWLICRVDNHTFIPRYDLISSRKLVYSQDFIL